MIKIIISTIILASLSHSAIEAHFDFSDQGSYPPAHVEVVTGNAFQLMPYVTNLSGDRISVDRGSIKDIEIYLQRDQASKPNVYSIKSKTYSDWENTAKQSFPKFSDLTSSDNAYFVATLAKTDSLCMRGTLASGGEVHGCRELWVKPGEAFRFEIISPTSSKNQSSEHYTYDTKGPLKIDIQIFDNFNNPVGDWTYVEIEGFSSDPSVVAVAPGIYHQVDEGGKIRLNAYALTDGKATLTVKSYNGLISQSTQDFSNVIIRQSPGVVAPVYLDSNGNIDFSKGVIENLEVGFETCLPVSFAYVSEDLSEFVDDDGLFSLETNSNVTAYYDDQCTEALFLGDLSMLQDSIPITLYFSGDLTNISFTTTLQDYDKGIFNFPYIKTTPIIKAPTLLTPESNLKVYNFRGVLVYEGESISKDLLPGSYLVREKSGSVFRILIH